MLIETAPILAAGWPRRGAARRWRVLDRAATPPRLITGGRGTSAGPAGDLDPLAARAMPARAEPSSRGLPADSPRAGSGGRWRRGERAAPSAAEAVALAEQAVASGGSSPSSAAGRRRPRPCSCSCVPSAWRAPSGRWRPTPPARGPRALHPPRRCGGHAGRRGARARRRRARPARRGGPIQAGDGGFLGAVPICRHDGRRAARARRARGGAGCATPPALAAIRPPRTGSSHVRLARGGCTWSRAGTARRRPTCWVGRHCSTSWGWSPTTRGRPTPPLPWEPKATLPRPWSSSSP